MNIDPLDPAKLPAGCFKITAHPAVDAIEAFPRVQLWFDSHVEALAYLDTLLRRPEGT